MKGLVLTLCLGIVMHAQSQTAYTWKGTVSSAWNVATNWLPNGVPGAADNVTIVTASNNCVLPAASSINNLTVSSGVLDLGGFALGVNGTTVSFAGGTVQNGWLMIQSPGSTSFGSGASTLNCKVYIRSATINIRNATFEDSLVLVKTGTTNDQSAGGNTFNGAVSMTNTGAGYLLMGNSVGDRYNANARFVDSGAANLYVAHNSSGNIFAGKAIFDNYSSSSGIFVSSYSTGTAFNGNIIVNSTGTQGVQFCTGNSTATATLAAGMTLSAGTGGFSAGSLVLRQFTQSGSTAQGITLTGTASLNFGPSSAFNGNIVTSSPALILSGCTFNGSSDLTKTGSSGDWGQGGNVYNGVCGITNSGSSYLVMGNTYPDTWNNDVTFTDNGSERLLPGWSSAGNQFNGNIYVNTSGSAQGIQFCGGNSTATATLAAGKTIQAGSVGLNAGYLYLRQFTQNGSAPIDLNSTGSTLYLGPSSSFGGAITATAPDIWAQGAIYNGPVVFNKTGGGSNHNNQYQNIFNASCTVNQQSSSGYFMLGYNSNDLFNDSIIVSSTGNGGIYLGWSGGTGTPALAAGKSIYVGAAGFSTGYLQLNGFTQLGNAAVNLSFTGTNTSITFARSSVMGGDVTLTAPDVYLNGAVFNGALNATKTGASGDRSTGGNVFNGVCNLTNSGAGFWVLGNNYPDVWNNDVTFTNNGTERLLPCWTSTGNQFNGNIYLNTAGYAAGIQFCGGNATATATLAAGNNIQAGSIGLNAGNVILKQFSSLSTTAVNLVMASSASFLQYGPGSSFAGNVSSQSPGLYFNGAVFAGSVNCIKTGASNDASSGNNIFNGVTTITNNGSGNLDLGNGNKDQFNADAIFNNTGSSNLYVAHNSPGNVFGGRATFNNSPSANGAIFVSPNSNGTSFTGNIVVSSTAGSGVQFCGSNASAAATLAAGQTITVGSAGFSSGVLLLRGFTQVGGTAQSLVLTGTGDLNIGPVSSFDGNLTSSSPTLHLNGGIFNGVTNFTKTGGSGDYSNGGNVFNGICTLTNNGTSYLLMGNVNPDTWNNDVEFINNGTERILPAWATTGNQFNGNIYVNTTGSAQGIQFCGGNSTATSLLAAGKTIQAGSAGLNAGYLQLKQFFQTGNTAINLVMANSATYIQYGPSSTFNGNITSTSPGLSFQYSSFNGSVNSTKTGASNDGSNGGNVFNGALTLTDNGSGYIQMANGVSDAYNGDARFVKSSTGVIYPNYNSNCTYAGIVSVSAATTVTFGSAGSGVATFNSSGGQTISSDAGTPAPVFTRLVVANMGSGVTLNNPVNVSGTLTMSTGLMNTSTTGLLTLLNGATTAAGTALSTSYVNGPMCCQKSSSGVTTLNFPVGMGADCRPIVLTVNHSNTTLYNYTVLLYNASAQALGYSMPPTIMEVSTVHYHTISRTNALGVSQPNQNLSGNQTVQVFFGDNDGITDGTAVRIAKNTYTSPTAWIDIGSTGGPAYSGGANLTGSIRSTSSPTAFNSFSTFTLATYNYLLPTKLQFFRGEADGANVDLSWATAIESNNSGFSVEKSRDAVNFTQLTWEPTKAIGGNSPVTLDYSTVDASPYPGVNYYRLVQTDVDGRTSYSQVITVHMGETIPGISVYPNPSSGTFWISGLGSNLSTVKIVLYDVSGKPVVEADAAVQGGTVRLDTRLNNGVYILKLQPASGTLITKNVIILK